MIDQIIAKLAAELNQPEEVVEKVIRSQFDFIANTMREGKAESVRLHYFGIFGVKQKAKERIDKLRERKEEFNNQSKI